MTNPITTLSREELSAYCKRVLDGSNNGSLMESVYRIALASLDAKPVGVVRSNNWIDEDSRGEHFWVEWARNRFPEKGTNLFIAPPAPSATDGWLLIPSKPSQAHLNSIAMRYRHDFYLLSDNQRESALSTARQMYEECSGQGFYSIPLPAAPGGE